ncbi:COP9 signalosome complex subunit 8 [Agrilus planipennis]|uniref:COP9 signalosome complex subunit 8 n=1 Tax=Agrilus planipennis TaxID=224129 RepID=A0A1W4WR20_AGRPL|nr:COP9 signalosome complex subunit 8 [Agrilus planipennis]
MVININLDKAAGELEVQELEAPNGVASPHVYERLLAIYLCQNDLCNAKFLWKRIPASVKTAAPELASIWAVGQQMWKRDFPAIYNALNSVTWSENVADIMREVQEITRLRAVDLITRAYSSISLDAVAHMTGLTSDVANKACSEKGWQIEADTNIVHPVRSSTVIIGQNSSEDQLYRLTDFVSFLEN